MTKSGREIMEILEAYDLTRCGCRRRSWPGVTEDRGPLCGVRDAGGDPLVGRPDRG